MPLFEFEVTTIDCELVEAASLEEAKQKMASKYMKQVTTFEFLHEVTPMSKEDDKEFTNLMRELKKSWGE
jgi:hypothetical protein